MQQEPLTAVLYRLYQAVWRYRVLFLALVFGLSVFLWSLIALMPNTYLAQAKVYIDTKSLLKPLLKGITVDSNAYSRVLEMTKILFSRANIEKIAAASDLELTAKSIYQRERLYQDLAKDIQLKRNGETDLYTIEVVHSNPKTAKLLVQSVLNLFVELSLQSTHGDRNHANDFLDQQINEYEIRLQSAERKLADFKRGNVDELPKENQGYYDKLQQALTQLEQAMLDLEMLKNQKTALMHQWQPDQKSGEKNNFVSNILLVKLNRLSQALAEKQIKYTDAYPDIQQLNQEIEQTKRQLLSNDQAGTLDFKEDSLAFQQWQIALSEITSQMAAAEAKVVTWKNRVEHLRTKVDSMIEVETGLSGLNRDYAILQRQHQALLERRESANITQQSDLTNESWQLQLIDPPYVLGIPIKPNRIFLNVAAFIFSIGSSLAFCYALYQFKPQLLSAQKQQIFFTFRNHMSSDSSFSPFPMHKQNKIETAIKWYAKPRFFYGSLLLYGMIFLLLLFKTSYY